MIYLVAGTRPNFMKIAPLRRELERRRHTVHLVHTGQHYDESMSEFFFRDLGMAPPESTLSAGGKTQAEQTACVVTGVEAELVKLRPSVVVVVGDVTSTMAAALAAAKLGVPVAHVEAGLRSRDWSMPEEINRVVTDQVSDLLLIPSPDAAPNLRAEGIPERRIVFVGNIMIDSLHYALERPTGVLAKLGLTAGEYAVATLHRPVNVDAIEAIERLLEVFEAIGARVPVVFPVHPRTVARMRTFGLEQRFRSVPGMRAIEPVGYNDFVTLMGSARMVATDSGGIQEETTALGIPCLTLREGTERPITVTEGTNTIVGTDPARVARETDRILAGQGKRGSVPDGWDGHTAARIVDALERFLAGSPPARTAEPIA